MSLKSYCEENNGQRKLDAAHKKHLFRKPSTANEKSNLDNGG